MEDYARAIRRRWGTSPGRSRTINEEVASRAVRRSAREILSGALDPQAEFSRAAGLLHHLRPLLLTEDDGALRLFPFAPRDWFEPGARLEFERLPTSAGPVSARSFASPRGDRIIAEIALPRAAASGAAGTSGSARASVTGAGRVELRLGPPAGSSLREVRVNGRRSRRFRPRRGTISLPPRRSIEVEAVLSKARR